MEKLLVMEGITKAFFGVSVLKGVDFELDHGEVHVLLGENGAGKSTLMKILCGAYTLDSGSITVAGQQIELSGYDPKKAEDAGIVTVYQNFHLIPHLSVAENLSLSRFTHERGFINWKLVDAHAREVLQKVDFAVDPKIKVRDLPVSQKQMLEIAIALSKNARILIMDEPTAALSRKETEALFKTISDIKTRGMGIIYISHKLEEVKQVGDRITVLRDGLSIATMASRDADLNKVITLMIGKELSRTQRESTASSNGAAFEARGIQSKSLPLPRQLLRFERERSSASRALSGPGKTELARALFGIDRLNGGALLLDGRPVQIDSPKRAVNLGIGYLSEDRDTDGLCLNMGVKENVSLVLLSKLRSLFFSVAAERRTVDRPGFLHRAEDRGAVPAGEVPERRKQAEGRLRQVAHRASAGSSSSTSRPWASTSERAATFTGSSADLRETMDKAVVFISSDVDEILEISDRVLVMLGGEVVAELDTRDHDQAGDHALQHARHTGSGMNGRHQADGNGETRRAGAGIKGLFRNQAVSMLVILIIMWGVLGILSPYFFTVDNLFEITLQTAVIAIIGAGMTFVILSGGIDLSVGSVFACSAVVGGMVFTEHAQPFACPDCHCGRGRAFRPCQRDPRSPSSASRPSSEPWG